MPMQPGDVDRTFADISKAKTLFEYNPNVDFREGVKSFVAWLDSRSPDTRLSGEAASGRRGSD
ncbi:MAG: hypothetical protein WD942_02950, partial [Dehalococcoidia bacterium]